MPAKKRKLSRRSFIKTAGAAGLISTTFSPGVSKAAIGDIFSLAANPATVPMRPFGKTGENVSILSLGGVLDLSDQIVFRQAYRMGVRYWDTADSYGRGKNEKAIGKYFSRFPADRKNIFLVTKAATSNPAKLTQKLNQSLERMKTDYVDLYFIHYVNDVEAELTPEVKAWAETARAEGKIRFFGFSTHKNMENCMLAAAKLGWIDGIMMSYNYRLMVTDQMKRAVDACREAGIGLTAMKTQAAFTSAFFSKIGSETDQALHLTERFLKKGYTQEQAKLKAVWENPDIASICSAISNMTILQANVAAAVNRQKLSLKDKHLLQQYAKRTSAGYCAGCAHICEGAVDFRVPISDIMRYAMYNNSYNDREKASAGFNALSAVMKDNMLKTDYAEAQRKCPQQIQIGRVVNALYRDLNRSV